MIYKNKVSDVLKKVEKIPDEDSKVRNIIDTNIKPYNSDIQKLSEDKTVERDINGAKS